MTKRNIQLEIQVIVEMNVQCQGCFAEETYREEYDLVNSGPIMKMIDNIYTNWEKHGCPRCSAMPMVVSERSECTQ